MPSARPHTVGASRGDHLAHAEHGDGRPPSRCVFGASGAAQRCSTADAAEHRAQPAGGADERQHGLELHVRARHRRRRGRAPAAAAARMSGANVKLASGPKLMSHRNGRRREDPAEAARARPSVRLWRGPRGGWHGRKAHRERRARRDHERQRIGGERERDAVREPRGQPRPRHPGARAGRSARGERAGREQLREPNDVIIMPLARGRPVLRHEAAVRAVERRAVERAAERVAEQQQHGDRERQALARR